MDLNLIIENAGGTTALAKILELGKGGAQRVNNWRRRGIPAQVQLTYAAKLLALHKREMKRVSK